MVVKVDDNIPVIVINDVPYHIRTLTPSEAYKLMGFSDFDKVKHHKDAILYHTAGNSIVVNVLEGIFKELLK